MGRTVFTPGAACSIMPSSPRCAPGGPDRCSNIDADVVIEGGECGLRSFILGLSALEPAEVDVRSYEAPYGVGYLVATISSPHAHPRQRRSLCGEVPRAMMGRSEGEVVVEAHLRRGHGG